MAQTAQLAGLDLGFVKTMAKRLRKELEASGKSVTHTTALGLTARALGYDGWHACERHLKKEVALRPGAPGSRADDGTDCLSLPAEPGGRDAGAASIGLRLSGGGTLSMLDGHTIVRANGVRALTRLARSAADLLAANPAMGPEPLTLDLSVLRTGKAREVVDRVPHRFRQAFAECVGHPDCSPAMLLRRLREQPVLDGGSGLILIVGMRDSPFSSMIDRRRVFHDLRARGIALVVTQARSQDGGSDLMREPPPYGWFGAISNVVSEGELLAPLEARARPASPELTLAMGGTFCMIMDAAEGDPRIESGCPVFARSGPVLVWGGAPAVDLAMRGVCPTCEDEPLKLDLARDEGLGMTWHERRVLQDVFGHVPAEDHFRAQPLRSLLALKRPAKKKLFLHVTERMMRQDAAILTDRSFSAGNLRLFVSSDERTWSADERPEWLLDAPFAAHCYHAKARGLRKGTGGRILQTSNLTERFIAVAPS